MKLKVEVEPDTMANLCRILDAEYHHDSFTIEDLASEVLAKSASHQAKIVTRARERRALECEARWLKARQTD